MKRFIFLLITVAFFGYSVASEVNFFNNELLGKDQGQEEVIRLARIFGNREEEKRNSARDLPLDGKSPKLEIALHTELRA